MESVWALDVMKHIKCTTWCLLSIGFKGVKWKQKETKHVPQRVALRDKALISPQIHHTLHGFIAMAARSIHEYWKEEFNGRVKCFPTKLSHPPLVSFQHGNDTLSSFKQAGTLRWIITPHAFFKISTAKEQPSPNSPLAGISFKMSNL